MSNITIGKVVAAEWNEEEQGIDLVLALEPSGKRLRGLCRSGPDPTTGRSLSPAVLKAKLAAIRNMKVYWSGPKAPDAELDAGQLSRLVIHLDLQKMDLSVGPSSHTPDANTFIARMFR